MKWQPSLRCMLGCLQDEKAAAGYFGFPVTNTIGGTVQPNPWTKDWVEFFREHRLGHMLRLAGGASTADFGDCTSWRLGDHQVPGHMLRHAGGASTPQAGR